MTMQTCKINNKCPVFYTYAAVFAASLLFAPQILSAQEDVKHNQKSETALVSEEVFMTNGRIPNINGLAKDSCFPVNKIVINGLELVERAAVRNAVAPLAYHCIGNVAAKAILEKLNQLHSDRGYITTQGYVPSQDIKSSRQFTINVVTGRIGRFIYRESNGDQGFGSAVEQLQKANGPVATLSGILAVVDALDNPLDRMQLLRGKTFPHLKPALVFAAREGDPLQIDELQHGIDQLNRAPSNRAQIKLEPGQTPGTSDVVIENARQDSFRLTLGYEINGADLNAPNTTTAQRLRVDAAKDNLVGINDSWAISYAGGLNSNELRTSFSMPFRRFNFGVDAGYSENLTVLNKSAELFSKSFNASSNLSYLLWLSKGHQTILQSSLAWRHSERFVNSVALLPQTLAIGRFGVQHIRNFDSAQVSIGFGISQGLTILDATRDASPIDATAPRAQFSKADAALSYVQAFKDVGQWRTDISGQLTNRPLYSDDQLTFGSIGTVRGFSRYAARVDRGFVVRSEFSGIIPTSWLANGSEKDAKPNEKTSLGFLQTTLSNITPYVFADFGHGRDLANKLDVSRAGLGAGVRYKSALVNVDFTVAQPVYRTGLKPARGANSPEFYLTLSLKAF